MKKAFSLAEILVALSLIGIISSILLPTLFNSMPNTKKYLFKSAYKTVEEVLTELINDDNLYNDADNGFKNTTNAGYFCDNFSSKINLIGPTDCANVRVPGSSVPNFTTSNGMRWWGFVNTFSKTENIWVDVDGINKGTNTVGSDILRINIKPLGQIVIIDCPENKFLTDNAVTTCP